MRGRAERPAGQELKLKQAQESPQSSPQPLNEERKTSNVIGGAQGEAGGTGEGVPTSRTARIGPTCERPDLRPPIAGVTSEIERKAVGVQRPDVECALLICVTLSASAANDAVP